MNIHKVKKDKCEDCLAGAYVCLELALKEAVKEKIETKGIRKASKSVLKAILEIAANNPDSKIAQILKSRANNNPEKEIGTEIPKEG